MQFFSLLFIFLSYEVKTKLVTVQEDIHKLIVEKFLGQTGIVYCLTVADTEKLSKYLRVRLLPWQRY